jgi:serine/threonine-protein kinase
MGIVYLARDTKLDRDVAIKALPEELAGDEERLTRFEREARSLAQLNHPNVAGIYGVEEQDGQRYLILEYVEGETLAERLDRGPLPVDEAIELAVEMAAGVEAAHEAGVIHRDLKPDNVKITPEFNVKVLDFGLARTPDGTGSSTDITAEAPTVQRATMPGVVLGTAPYMSPEQARGRRLDKRSDIWSFGVVLYECLTGASPFVGETASDTIGAILHKEVDFDRLPAETPPLVRHVLTRCLERDRSKRLRDIGDARLDLVRAGAEDGAATMAASGRSSRLARAGWLVALLVTAVLARELVKETPGPGVVRTSIMAPEGIAIQSFLISPDGAQVSIIGHPAEIGDQPGVQASALYLRDLAAAEMTKVPGSEGAFTHRYAPDGATIAYATRGADSSDPGRVMRLPADGSSSPVEVVRVPPELRWGPGEWFCWTPDGALAFLDRTNQTLALFDAGTGRELRRMKIESDGAPPQLSELVGPFGDRFVQVRVEQFLPGAYRVDVGLIDVETGRFTIAIEDANQLRLTREGNVVFGRSDSICLSPFDPTRRELTGRFRTVQDGVATADTWLHGAFGLADNGTLVYRTGGVQGAARELVFIERDGEISVWFDERRSFVDHLCIAPDGSRFAVLIAGSSGFFELWVSEVARPRLRRLHTGPAMDCYEPTFTPDGEHVVLSTWNPSAEERGSVIAMRFDGTGTPRRIFGGWKQDDWIVPVSVSADGARVLLSEYSAGRAKLYETRLDGVGEPRLLREADLLFAGRYAPTGLPLVAFITSETGRAESYVATLDETGLGPAVPVLNRGSWSHEWMVDDEHGLCLLHFDLEWREWMTPITLEDGRVRIGESSRTGRTGDVRYGHRAATVDGRYFVIRKGADEQPPVRLEIVQNWLESVEAP